MRTRKGLIAAFALAVLFVLSAPRPAQAAASVSVSFFHDQLSPHGRWVVAGSYGDVWVPGGVAAGWAPYVDGEWVWTDYGWTWVSYDPWGDIPYHYGTWAYVSDYGWSWVPGTVWAPAWVTWAYSDDYIGWAPVPATFVISAGGYFGGPVVLPASRYCFVPTSQFVGVNASTVRVPVQQNTTIFANTTRATRFQVSNGVVHTAGLDPSRIERVTGRHIQSTSINQVHSAPTTVAAAGLSKSRSVGVVMPAKTRSQELRTASSSHAAEKHAPAATSKETHTNTAAKTSPRKATTHENTHVAQKSKAQPKPEPKAKPEHSTTSAQSASRSAAKPQHKAPAEQHAKTSSTTSQKHVSTSSPRTAEVRHENAPQAKVAEQSHQAQPKARTEEHAAPSHVQSSRPAPPKEHAAPQRVASNQPSQHAAPPPPKVKNPPPPKERPKEEKPKSQE